MYEYTTILSKTCITASDDIISYIYSSQDRNQHRVVVRERCMLTVPGPSWTGNSPQPSCRKASSTTLLHYLLRARHPASCCHGTSRRHASASIAGQDSAQCGCVAAGMHVYSAGLVRPASSVQTNASAANNCRQSATAPPFQAQHI